MVKELVSLEIMENERLTSTMELGFQPHHAHVAPEKYKPTKSTNEKLILLEI